MSELPHTWRSWRDSSAVLLCCCWEVTGSIELSSPPTPLASWSCREGVTKVWPPCGAAEVITASFYGSMGEVKAEKVEGSWIKIVIQNEAHLILFNAHHR